MSEDSPSSGISRRSALKIGAAGCTTAVVASTAATNPFAKQKISFDQWQSLVGSDIQVLSKSFVDEIFDKPRTLRLIDVAQLKMKTQTDQSVPGGLPEYSISLCFESEMRTQLESATYKVLHPEMGECDLFINEIQPKAEAKVRTYESILS